MTAYYSGLDDEDYRRNRLEREWGKCRNCIRWCIVHLHISTDQIRIRVVLRHKHYQQNCIYA